MAYTTRTAQKIASKMCYDDLTQCDKQEGKGAVAYVYLLEFSKLQIMIGTLGAKIMALTLNTPSCLK